MDNKTKNDKNTSSKQLFRTEHSMQVIDIPSNVTDNKLWGKATSYQLIYSLCGLFLGLICVIGGIVLFLHGVTGSTSWTAKFIGAESDITDAAPGAILFIVGLFVVWVTKFKIKIKK